MFAIDDTIDSPNPVDDELFVLLDVYLSNIFTPSSIGAPSLAIENE